MRPVFFSVHFVNRSLLILPLQHIFADYLSVDRVSIRDFHAELLIKEISNSTTEYHKEAMLLYKVVLDANNTNNTSIGYVNAKTGKVEATESFFCDYDAVGLFNTRYHGTKYANTDFCSNAYRLYDSSRGAVIHTQNLNGLDISSNLFTEITDEDNNWQYADFTNRGDMGMDVHWALQKIYDRLYTAHGKNSFDNNGREIKAYVDATISGTTDNAAWYFLNNYKALCFGRGASHPRPYSSMDVVAHEFGHGITDFQIGWGTAQRHLNEGLSDIWGVIMDYRYAENDSQTWKIGENIYASGSTDCLRNIMNPGSSSAYTKIAATYQSDDYNAGSDYYKSGVFSHWFYLLVNGGSFNYNGTCHDFCGVGMDIAENLVVEAVYNSYLRNCDDYPDVRDAFIAAARSLNIDGLESTVDDAWRAVGVEENQYYISGPTRPCGMTLYSIDGLPSTYTVEWSFQNSLSPVALLVSYDSSNSHECTVDNTSHAYFNDVLEARVFINNHYLRTLTKRLRTGADFMASMINEFDNPPIHGGQIINKIWTVHDGDSINVLRSGTITITSNNFVDATITSLATGVSNWNHFGTEISFHVNAGVFQKTLMISGQKDCSYFKFHLVVPAAFVPHFNYSPELEINSSKSSREITISINSPSGQTGIGDYDDATNIVGTKARLSISNVVTGNILYEGEMANNGVTVNTTGWESGLYAVKAIAGDCILTKKITVR